MNFQTYDYWSPILGCEACRVSMVDSRGSEYFAIVPKTDGADWRRRKIDALEALEQAIQLGLPPGEIRWRQAGEGA